jgi:antitoxin HigA-1
MPMKNPPHPGETVRYDCLEPLGLSVTEGAKILGVTRQALNNLVNGKSGISPEMAIRLHKAFGGSAAVWLGIQMDYDLAQAMKRERSIKGEVRRAIAREPVQRTGESTERPKRKRRAGKRVREAA